jgi:outer membrane protein assembly factor BamB
MLTCRSAVVFAIVFAVLHPVTVTAADWPTWRGPRGDGRADGTGYPLTWSAIENIRWKTAIPGIGHSSPIISNNRVFVTACREDERTRILYCLDRTNGKILWERVVLTADLEPKHKLNSYASSTPAADGERIYVTFLDQPWMRVYCYDYAGNKIWDVSPGEFHSKHGFCSPPLLYKNLVIVNGDQDAEAYLVALDRQNGREVWRTARPGIRSYCPPVVYELAGKKQLVLTGAKSTASYDPETGKLHWVIDGPTEQFVSSLVVEDNILFLTAGYPEHWVMAIDPSGSGNVTKSHVLWSRKNEGGYVPSPVAHAGHFYLVTDNGLASCWEAKTGRLRWKERIGRHHSASAVAAEGRIYFTDDDGITFVLKAAPDFEILATNRLGERCFATPAFAGSEIFIRGEQHLFCISESPGRGN